MSNAFFGVPVPKNEPVKSYAPGSAERIELKKTLSKMRSKEIEIPMIIGGKEVFTDQKKTIRPPHDIHHTLGTYNRGNATHIQMAIEAALAAKPAWEALPWQERAAIFLKAADLLAGPYRAKLNAATMLGQSKNCYQAEIDAACELIDFFRYNVHYMTQIFSDQPYSPEGTWNRMEYRPLEGFVFALTPFNFTSICGNLTTTPAMLGNTIVWKCSETQIYSAKVIMDLFKDAGLPDGVINLIFVDGPTTGSVIFKHPDFAGIHFTGSTGVFQGMWRTIGENISTYKTYPRIVGETGGKDFVIAHPSAKPKTLATALSRGAFEYQGQKCSAASRAYIPASLWDAVRELLEKDLKSMKMGSPEDFSNFINAVIDERSFDKLAATIQEARNHPDAEVIIGGECDKSKGYFIRPTVILAKKPDYTTMVEELFGPILTIYVYPDEQYEQTLHIVNETSPYALTGAIFSQDRYALQLADRILKHAAGNYYINDKPTGAVVGQQPFGGARASGTNDKAGSLLNLYRWVSARAIKENFNPPTDYRYPFLAEE